MIGLLNLGVTIKQKNRSLLIGLLSLLTDAATLQVAYL